MKLLKGTRVKDEKSTSAPIDFQGVEKLILINCSVQGNSLTAGYFYCDQGLQAGNYKVVSELGRSFIIKLPDQAVNLPGIGQQFNYPFQIVEEI